jgi:hypothetical protein
MKAVQVSALPTNKLTIGALVAPAVMEVWQRVMTDLYPPLAGPEMAILVAWLVGIMAAYPVKDRANIPVE